MLPWVLWPLAAYFFGATIEAAHSAAGVWPLGLLGLTLAAGGALAARFLLPAGGRPRGRAGAALARRFGELLLLVLVALFVLAAALTTAADAENPTFTFLSALLLLCFRVAPVPLVAVHLLSLVAPGTRFWVGSPDAPGEVLVGGTVLHSVAFAVGALLARRYRRQFLAGWRQVVTQAREQLRMREELALAREVQLSMLPLAVPLLPWLDVAAACVPAAEVGGDYYDFFAAEDDATLAVTVADVAGHGLASGLVLATVRSGLALLMEDPGSGDGMLRRLDRLVRRGSRRVLVTLALARFDSRRGELTVTSAGHPPVLVRRGLDRRVEEIGPPAPPLGTRLPAGWPDAVTGFAAGDAFLLYSDGVVEMRDAGGEVYGFGRLRELLARWDGAGGAAGLCAAVIADLEWYRGAASQEDDLTVVAVVACNR